MPLTLKNFYRVITWRTFTVTFTESSSPSSFNPVYSDDAAWLTAWSTDFDEFFWYSAVRLDANWVETDEVTQADSGWNGKLDITQLWILTSWDNVMIKFPRLWIKMEKNGSTCTLSITSEEWKAWYQYYAHTRGNDIKDAFYLWAYKSSTSSNVLKSWSGKAPAASINPTNARSYSQANGTWYDEIAIYQRMFINALYMMKFGNPNSQANVGKWWVNQNNAANTWNTNSQTNATYWTSDWSTQIKLFWLEDWWWNVYEWVDGIYVDGNNILTCTNNTNFNNTWTWYTNSWVAPWSLSGNITWMACTNTWMFLPTAASWSNYTQYWCDVWYVASWSLWMFGGTWNNDTSTGAFMMAINQNSSFNANFVWTRLMYL